MNSAGHVEAEQRNGNLHVKVYGAFTRDRAAEIAAQVRRLYTGAGNVFIHTIEVTEVDQDVRPYFAEQLNQTEVPAEHLYLTGEKGLEIGYETAKVIVYRKKKGPCQGCRRRKGASLQPAARVECVPII